MSYRFHATHPIWRNWRAFWVAMKRLKTSLSKAIPNNPIILARSMMVSGSSLVANLDAINLNMTLPTLAPRKGQATVVIPLNISDLKRNTDR